MAEFSTTSLMASLLFGTLGVWIFRQSRKRMNVKLSIIGVAMMGYSFFMPTALLNWIVGFALSAAARYVWHQDDDSAGSI